MKKQSNTQQTPSYYKSIPIGVVGIVVVLGAFYLYITNQVAVQGYAIREAENQIAQLKQSNNQLRIQEAELKSLYRIEEAGKRLNMFEPVQVSYIEESGPIALR
jgi:cell division protein FtsL